MTTLIHCHGAVEGRCDAKCYTAVSKDCTCICNGMNHGKGEQGAIENVRELTRDQVRAIEARGGFVADEIRQAVLL